MTLNDGDSSYALQRYHEFMTYCEELEGEYQRARIRSTGMVPCKGILLDAITDDWSGCDTKNHTLTDCPSCHGLGYMPIQE
jgi:hypothetical protein